MTGQKNVPLQIVQKRAFGRFRSQKVATLWLHPIDVKTHNPRKPLFTMEPLAGIEPATYSLRVNCSTPELQRRNRGDEV